MANEMTIEEQLIKQTQPAPEGNEPEAVATPVSEPVGDLPPVDQVDVPPQEQLPGNVLAARREELRLSIDEVAGRLKLAPRQVVSIETNDFGSLPGMAVVRGFIRSYAKLLELDPLPLVAMLVHEPNPAFDPMVVRRPLPSPGFGGRRYAPPTSHRSGSRRMTGLAVLLLGFVGALAFLAYRSGALQLPSADFGQVRELIAPADAPAVPAAPAATDVPAAPAAGEAPATASAVNVAPDAANALELKLREDAWVEVIAVDGERKLVSKLMKAGSVELIEIAEPVVLVVGNAAGVDAALRGQALNLKAVARDNVAKLNLK